MKLNLRRLCFVHMIVSKVYDVEIKNALLLFFQELLSGKIEFIWQKFEKWSDFCSYKTFG